MRTSDQISALRKEGKLDEAYEMAKAWIAKKDHVHGAESSMAWVLDAKIRKALDTSSRDKGPNAAIVNDVENLLYEYMALKEVRRPSLVHSLILGRVLKIADRWDGFFRFVKWWGADSFREEDYQGQMSGKKEHLPLFTRFARTFAKAALAGNERGPLVLDEVVMVMETISGFLKKLPKDEWLPFYYGRFLLSINNTEKAYPVLLKALRYRAREGWAWITLAEACRFDYERARAFYSYGIFLEGNGGKSRQARIDLASRMAAEKDFDGAAYHLMKARKASKKPDEALQALLEAEWFTERDGKNLPKPLTYEAEAFDFVFEGRGEAIIGVIDAKNEKRRHAHLSFADKNDGVFSYQYFPALKEWPLGTIVEGQFEGEELLRLKEAAEDQEIEAFLVVVRGKIRKKDNQAFGFLSGNKDAFVAPGIISANDIADTQEATMLCVYAKKPGGLSSGWRALKVISLGEKPAPKPKKAKKPRKPKADKAKADAPREDANKEASEAVKEEAKPAPKVAEPVFEMPAPALPIAEAPAVIEAPLAEVPAPELPIAEAPAVIESPLAEAPQDKPEA